MAKFGLYSKNNLEECITIIERNYIRIDIIYMEFSKMKNLTLEEFSKLFTVKKVK